MRRRYVEDGEQGVPPSEQDEMVFLPQNDEVKTGVIEAVLDDRELAMALALVLHAAELADQNNCSWFVVRSLERLYTTDTMPTDTKDIDALYLVEMRPQRQRSLAASTLLGRLADLKGSLLK